MIMFWLVLIVFLAIISGLIGFSRLSAAATTVGRGLLAVFVVAFLVVLFQGAIAGFY